MRSAATDLARLAFLREQPVDVGLLGSIDHECEARDPVARTGAVEVLLPVDGAKQRAAGGQAEP